MKGVRRHWVMTILGVLTFFLAIGLDVNTLVAEVNYDPEPAKETGKGIEPEFDWLNENGVSGFAKRTLFGETQTMMMGNDLELAYDHVRSSVSTLYTQIQVTLTIWKADASGKSASLWKTIPFRSVSHGGFLNYWVSGEYQFVPDTSGTYYVQFTSDQKWNTASPVTQINVEPRTTDITATIPDFVLPSSDYSYPVAATVIPTETTDPLAWYIEDTELLQLDKTTNRQTTISFSQASNVNLSTEVTNPIARVGLWSGGIQAESAVELGRLPAVETTLIAMNDTNIGVTVNNLEKFAKNFPVGTTWSFQWYRYNTQYLGQSLSIVSGSAHPIADSEVLGPSHGSSISGAELTSERVKLQANKASPLTKQSVLSMDNKLPLAIKLELTAHIPSVGEMHFTTNFASFTITRGEGILALSSVPDAWITSYSFTEIYNHVTKDNRDNQENELSVTDTREWLGYETHQRWALSVTATPFIANTADTTITLPMSIGLILGTRESMIIDGTPKEIAVGTSDDATNPKDFNIEAHTQVTSEYKPTDTIVAETYTSTVNWNLTTNVPFKTLE